MAADTPTTQPPQVAVEDDALTASSVAVGLPQPLSPRSVTTPQQQQESQSQLPPTTATMTCRTPPTAPPPRLSSRGANQFLVPTNSSSSRLHCSLPPSLSARSGNDVQNNLPAASPAAVSQARIWDTASQGGHSARKAPPPFPISQSMRGSTQPSSAAAAAAAGLSGSENTCTSAPPPANATLPTAAPSTSTLSFQQQRDPLRLSRFLSFPVHVGERGTEINLFDGLVSRNVHEVRLLRSGFYGLRLHNQNDSAWDGLYLGIGRMKAVAEFTVEPPPTIPPLVKPGTTSSAAAAPASLGQNPAPSKSPIFQISSRCSGGSAASLSSLSQSGAAQGNVNVAYPKQPEREVAAKGESPADIVDEKPPQYTQISATKLPSAMLSGPVSDQAPSPLLDRPALSPQHRRHLYKTDAGSSSSSTNLRRGQDNASDHDILVASSTDIQLPNSRATQGSHSDLGQSQQPSLVATAEPQSVQCHQPQQLQSNDGLEVIKSQCSRNSDEIEAVPPSVDGAASNPEDLPSTRCHLRSNSCEVGGSLSSPSTSAFTTQQPLVSKGVLESSASREADFRARLDVFSGGVISSSATHDRSDDEDHLNEEEDEDESCNGGGFNCGGKSKYSARQVAADSSESIEVITGSGQLVTRAQQEKIVYFYVAEKNSTLKLTVSTSLTLGMRVRCRYDLIYCGSPKAVPANPYVPFMKSAAILCLDGGGVLGISSLKILERVELELQKELLDPTVRLLDCFDMVCGTSTGGIIALGLQSGLSVKEMINLWASISGRIFEGNRTLFSGIFFDGYDINRMKSALIESLGQRFMSTYARPYCFVTSVDVKHNPYELFLLRNYTHAHLTNNEHRGGAAIPIWAAGWATSAAPTYLRGPIPEDLEKMGLIIHPEVQLVDGAMKANNPTLVALEEAARLSGKKLQQFIESDLDVLLSVGTGQPTLRQTMEKTEVSTFQIIMNSGHLLTSARNVHRDVLHWLGDHEDIYFRFNVPGIGDIALDAVDKSSYDIIIKATNDYLSDEKYYDVKRIVRRLSRRLRR